MTSINASTTVRVKKPKNPSVATSRTKKSATLKSKSRTKGGPQSARQSLAPKLHPKTLITDDQISALRALPPSSAKAQISELLSHAFGSRNFSDGIAKPHTASTTRDRGNAAADIAVASKELGPMVVLKRYGVLAALEATLLPEGIANTFKNADTPSGMRRIVSTNSLNSMTSDGNSTVGTDSRKGLTTPPQAREGALLILRALCDIAGRACEPYVVPLLAAVLDESRSSNSGVRDAAEDTSKAIIKLANPLATRVLLTPVLFAALNSPEWRVKQNALDRLSQLAGTAPLEIAAMLPEIIPIVTPQVWDTKPQVTKAAASCLLTSCTTNPNADIAPALPALVNAIVKPSDTMKAIDELMATTFVSTVDAGTLAILCPVLSRGLKQKVARDKRACCVVIENMSRLVDSPAAVAPFGPLLVPDLKKVVDNVQFEDMRDIALAALRTLTKALGHDSVEDAYKAIMAQECAKAEEEERRIKEEREEERIREEETRMKEEEEKRQWKEAMEAHRLLEQMREKEEEEKKAEENRKKELSKQSVKGSTGKCQGCGLKKCKKECLFNQ